MNSSELLQLRCPQNWDLGGYKYIEQRLDDNIARDEDYLPDDTKYASQIGRFLTCCLLSYEKYRQGKYSEALKLLDNTDDITDDFMKKYDRVFKHVSMASRAHVLFKLQSFNLVKEIVDKIKEEKFTELEEACFNFIEGSMIMSYGQSGAQRSVVLIKEALMVVPDEAEFNFSLGHLLGRMRHYHYRVPLPSDKEWEALRCAVSLRKDLPKYAIRLARLYMDTNLYVNKKKSLEYNKLATAIYRNLLQNHNSLSGNDIARCVFDLTKLQCHTGLEEYARIARTKSKSLLMNYYIGRYFLHIKKYGEAFDCLEKASARLPYVTGQVLLVVYRLNHNCIEDEDIEERVANWTRLYGSSDKHFVEFLMSISQFYLIVKKDLRNAAVYFSKAFERGITQPFLLNLSLIGEGSNYLSTLKDELVPAHLSNHADIRKARGQISKLPRKITSEKNTRYPKMLATVLRKNIF